MDLEVHVSLKMTASNIYYRATLYPRRCLEQRVIMYLVSLSSHWGVGTDLRESTVNMSIWRMCQSDSWQLTEVGFESTQTSGG